MYKLVSSKSIISQFKKSKYFKVDLGRSFVSSGSNGAVKGDLSRQEEFVKFYYDKTNHFLHKEGKMGQIEFYSEINIKNEVILYYNDLSFVFPHDTILIREHGVEKYLGGMIKEIETTHLSKMKETKPNEANMSESEKIELAVDRVRKNPGNVTYADIEALIKKKRGY